MRVASTSNAIATVADGPGGAAHDRSLLITGGNQVAAYVYDGSPRTITGTTTLSVGQTFVSAAKTSREGGVNRLACFLNGKLESQLNVSDNGYTAYSAPQVVAGYGGAGTSTLGSNIDLALLLVFSRGLSDSEIKNLSDNPWQIFKSTSPVFYSSTSVSTVLVADSGSYSLTGAAATAARTTTADSGSYNLTGASAELLKALNLSADSGSYSLTGATATAARTITAASGSYNLTGSDAALNKALALSADSGAYNLTGASAELSKTSGKTLSADSGSYSLVGSDATLNRTRSLSADSGSYNLTGSSAELNIGRSLSADSGAYNVTGAAATLTQAKVISADAGSYALDGQAASFIRTYNLLAAAGAFNTTGSAASLLTSRSFSADSGAYSIDGAAATLTKVSASGYPDPSDVREGVVYGPGGIYVGTLKVGGKVLYIFDD
jgi:hypothetical protein